MNFYIPDLVDELIDDQPIGMVILADSAVLSGVDAAPPMVITHVPTLGWTRCGCQDCLDIRAVQTYLNTLTKRQRKAFHKLNWQMQRALATC